MINRRQQKYMIQIELKLLGIINVEHLNPITIILLIKLNKIRLPIRNLKINISKFVIKDIIQWEIVE
jgi:hypothetical protein